MQAPPPPKAAAKPMVATCRCAGSSFVVATTTAGNNGPRQNPTKPTAIEETVNDGTSQKSSCIAMADARYNKIARFSPSLGVTNPSTTRPTVIPNQKLAGSQSCHCQGLLHTETYPVAIKPDSNCAPFRTSIMKVTTQPPSATSMPTYTSKKKALTHATLVFRAARVAPRMVSSDKVRRNRVPDSFQKAAVDVTSSSTAPPIYILLSGWCQKLLMI